MKHQKIAVNMLTSATETSVTAPMDSDLTIEIKRALEVRSKLFFNHTKSNIWVESLSTLSFTLTQSVARVVFLRFAGCKLT